jgi:peptide/nickel transport system substrate-binding protein
MLLFMKRLVTFGLAFAVLLAGCSKVGTTGAGGRHEWTHPGVFTYGENQNPHTLNPVVGADATAGDLSMYIFSYAVRYDQNANPVPDALSEIPTLANGDVSPDGLTLKYKLRHNITFQDGVPLTCKDLKFTWQVVMNPHTNVVATDGYRDIKDIDCSNPYVAVIHMKRLYAPYLQQLWGVNGNAPILPEHLLAKYNDNKGSINTAPYNSLPIGSGPFQVVKWNRDSDVDMVAYPKYFLGAPKLKQVIFKIVPDANTLLTLLQTHAIDMLARGTGLHWPDYQRLASDPANGLTAIRVNSFLFTHIDFNLQHAPLSDPAVRRALAYGTNRKQIIDDIFHGSAYPAETDQHPTLSWASTTDLTHYPFDPDKARKILDDAGWKVGPDGVRVKNGQRLEFSISTQTESNAGIAEQTVLQREWRDIGVQADVKNYPTAAMFQNGSTGILEGGHYDVALYSWVAAADPDDSALYASHNFGPRGQNTLFWKNAKVDVAEADALGTIDQARRKADYKIIQQQMTQDVPTIVLFFLREPYVYNTDLKNFKPSPVISAFWDPWEYEI